jgi:hypothetical protein
MSFYDNAATNVAEPKAEEQKFNLPGAPVIAFSLRNLMLLKADSSKSFSHDGCSKNTTRGDTRPECCVQQHIWFGLAEFCEKSARQDLHTIRQLS